MQRVYGCVLFALGEIQLRSKEGRLGSRIGNLLLGARRGVCREPAEELAAACIHPRGKLGLVIREESKRLGSGEFLPHEQHWRLGRKQKQRGQSTVAAGAGELMQALAIKRVGDLVVILQKGD